ncbi:MAG: hypothetical protein JNL74_10240 [Fibrobacteres bacterium]|nr:hypothetical protein [Fibrobacterota bacterium]
MNNPRFAPLLSVDSQLTVNITSFVEETKKITIINVFYIGTVLDVMFAMIKIQFKTSAWCQISLSSLTIPMEVKEIGERLIIRIFRSELRENLYAGISGHISEDRLGDYGIVLEHVHTIDGGIQLECCKIR